MGLLDQSAIGNLLNAAVAVGTLALAALTYYQLRLLSRERRATQARELADRVYTPLLRDVAKWTKPEEVYGDASCKTWTELKLQAPYLGLRVPRDIATKLDEAERVFGRIGFLLSQVRPMIHLEANRLGRKLATEIGITGEKETMLRIVDSNSLIVNLDIGKIWAAKLSLKDWAQKYVAAHYPVEDWKVEILFGPDPVGGTKEAEAFMEQLSGFLKTQPLANELLERIWQIIDLGRIIIPLIDQNLAKPVAPWG